LRLSYALVNNSLALVYDGANANINSANAEPIAPGGMISDDTDQEDVYMIGDTAGEDVRITEILRSA
jgi:hypothetical protein